MRATMQPRRKPTDRPGAAGVRDPTPPSGQAMVWAFDGSSARCAWSGQGEAGAGVAPVRVRLVAPYEHGQAWRDLGAVGRYAAGVRGEAGCGKALRLSGDQGLARNGGPHPSRSGVGASAPASRASFVHAPRMRHARFGEPVQIKASPHVRFKGRLVQETQPAMEPNGAYQPCGSPGSDSSFVPKTRHFRVIDKLNTNN